MLNFSKMSRFEFEIIAKIAQRVKKETTTKDDILTINMDLSAAHLDCGLKLDELLRAPEFDFAHDYFGIRKHINRKTGKLEGFFVPRYALKQ